MLSFIINYPTTQKGKSEWNRRFGLNAYYAGKHPQQRRRDAEELHMIARSAMHKAGIRSKMIDRPVKVKFYWDDGLDCDNHAVLGKAFWTQ